MLITDVLLLDYKRCQRRAFLHRYGDVTQQDPERDFLLKLRQENQSHVSRVLEELYPHYQQPQLSSNWRQQAQETEVLMSQGVECIYKGVLWHFQEDFLGHEPLISVGMPHLLVKVPGESKFGSWNYIPVSIQLGRRPKPDYKAIAGFYADLLDKIQEGLPTTAQVILRPLKFYDVDLTLWIPRVNSLITECTQMLAQREEPEVFISRQRCNLCHWYTHCYNLAQSVQHLSLVPGVTPSRYESLQTLGVETVESLAEACPINMGELIGLEVATVLKQQAQSILENRAIPKPNSSLNRYGNIPTQDIEFYFDIEAEPELNLDYLLGILRVDRLNQTQQFYPFLAETPAEEGQIWGEFVTFVTVDPHAPIFHYSEYEVETIKRLGNLYGTPTEQVENILSRCVDLHKQVTNLAILPVESYSLKSLANWLGFQWRDSKASGDQCVCWYDQWLKSRDRTLLEFILRYNEDDCLATFHLKNWLVDFLQTQPIVH